jgi:Chaperone of endosialidase
MLDIAGGLGFTTTTSTVPTNGIYSPSANELNITTSGATAVAMTSTGSVGIGTANVGFPLAVYGSRTDPAGGGCAWSLAIQSAGNYNVDGDIVIGMTNPGTPATTEGVIQTNNNVPLILNANGGNVGINMHTTTPAQALEVNGEVQIDTFGSAASTTVCENGGILSSCSSSIRYKEKVKPAPFGLNEVMEMRPVTFKWKGRDENDLGLVAEDVEKVNPLFVTYKDGHIEGVKYEQLTAVLIRAVQQQQAEINE